MMDLAPIMPWVTSALSIIAFLTAIKNILGSPAKDNAEKIAQLDKKLTEHDRRIQAAESELKHMPDKDSVHRLQVAAMVKTSEATERATRRVEEFLMSRAS
jgi:hypothetical protein